MKKIIVNMLVALAVFTIYAQDVTVDNNLSFGWTRSRQASAVNDTTVKVSEKYSVCLTNDTEKHNGLQKIVKLEQDTQYELTFMVKGERIEAIKGKGAGIVLGGNRKYSRFTSNVDNSLETGTFDWRKGSGIFTTSRFKTGNIAMTLNLNVKGKVWFDKIQFRKIPEVEKEPEVTVRGDELTINNGLSSGWTRSRLASVANDTAVKISSKYSICLINDAVKHNGLQKIVKLEPDTQYMLTFMVKGDNIEGDKGRGACIVLAGNKKYSRATSNADNSMETGTFDWRKGSCRFTTSRFKTGNIVMALSITGKGKVWFDDIKVTKISEASMYFRNHYDTKISNAVFYPDNKSRGFYEPNEPVTLKLKAQGKDLAEYEVKLIDFSGKQIGCSIKGKVQLPGTVEIKLPGYPNGYYVAEADISINGTKSCKIQSAFAVSPKFDKRDPFFQFGYGVYPDLYEGYKRVGAGTISLKANWQTSYKLKRSPQFLYELYMKKHRKFLESNDFKLYFTVTSYVNKVDREPSEIAAGKPFLNDFLVDNFIGLLDIYLKNHGSRIAGYNIQCEIPSEATLPKFCGTWSEAMYKFVCLSRIASRMIKAQYPKAQVWVGGNNIKRNSDSIEEIVMRDLAKEKIDGYFIDAYTGSYDIYNGTASIPEGELLSFYEAASKLSQRFGLGKEIRNEELGYRINYGSAYNQYQTIEQARLTARAIIMTKGTGIVSGFELHQPSQEVPVQENQKNDSLLMTTCWRPVKYNGRLYNIPMPGGAAYATAAHHLGFAKIHNSVKSEDFYAYVFSREDGSTVAILWNIKEAKEIALELPEKALVTDMVGREKTLDKGTHKITVTQNPLYLTLKNTLAADAFSMVKKALQEATPSFYAFAKRQSLNNVIVFVRNASHDNLPVKIMVNGKTAGQKDIHAGVTVSLTVPYGENIQIVCQGKSYPVKSDLAYIQVSKLTGKPVFDGSGAWFAKLSPLKLRVPDNVYPKDALHPERCYFKSNFNPNGHNYAADCYFGYDDSNLYFAVKANDPKHFPSITGNVRHGDSLQWVISTRDVVPKAVRALHADRKEFATELDYGATLSEKGTVHQRNIGKMEGKNFPCKVSRKKGVTLYEVAVPFKNIGINPKSGKPIRFSLAVLDKTAVTDKKCPYQLAITDGVGDDAGEYRLLMFR